MKSASIVAVAASATVAVATPWGHHYSPWGYGPASGSKAWNLKKFTSLVAFGDSYTDDSRLGYFINNGTPPVGYANPANYHSADGGRPWPQYVAQYTGAHVYNYAVSGAVCSNNITPRYFSAIKAPFPSVEQYEVPAYIADSKYSYPNGTKFLTVPASQTVYSIFIGTNDLGNYAFLTDSQVAGTTIVNYTDCVFNQLQTLYSTGARYFVLQNVAPLNLVPQYADPAHGGLASSQYWPDKANYSTNITEISYKMAEYVALVNDVFTYQTPYLVEVAKRFPGAHFAVMDINGLLTDIYNNPSAYLNGTAPLNVTSYVNLNGKPNASPDSFIWYDELHPSEQTDRIIARTFVDVVKGSSKWATYWSS
ncbi:hypothetical protein B0A48_09208 [Cryoendolithus antarcticus]|uniref:SGNH hydrolase-type esterase domain-containing protein n=1 Tax=Cryoendolithus antarcticus TaxID=1507870 RepID=A0A1V8T2A4_9PEZI|nr:hypothetical protein B0A48_09208 [Cryoendolithus antarcticus]OQO20343.1 hypothetical protein B0A51_10270 [Rachicladosporium sp. CCFEE 5018]